MWLQMQSELLNGGFINTVNWQFIALPVILIKTFKTCLIFVTDMDEL